MQPNLALWGLGATYALAGRREEARRVLADLAEGPGQKDLLMLGMIHAMLGDRQQALDWLEAAHEEPVDWFPWIATRGGFDAFTAAAVDMLRDEPRFRRLVEALAIPEAG